MNFKSIVVLFITMNVISSLNAQYISSVTRPDLTKPIVIEQNDMAYKYAQSINADDLKKYLTFLASNECEGRETGQPGNVKAANFIAEHFQRIQLEDPLYMYKQPVKFTFSSWDDTDIFVNKERFKHLWDYMAYPNKNNDIALVDTNMVYFLGYGIDDPKYSDYKGKTFKDAVIVINNGEPMKEDSTYWITSSSNKSEWSTNLDKKLNAAYKRGVKLVLIIDEDIKKTLGENRKNLIGPSVELGDKSKDKLPVANHAIISTGVAKAIFGKEEGKIISERKNIMKKGKFKPVQLKLDFKMNMKKKVTSISSQNVIGFIEGSTKPEEVIVVSAHYDHLGKKGEQIFFGADDNGSGTSTVLELAEAFSLARKDGFRSARSIAFVLFTGEEKGLLGSEFYTKHPTFKLENTIANVNIDMVGRVDDKYKDDPNYIYVIGSDRLSTELHKVNEDMNQKYTQLTLDYKFNAEDDPNRYYFRSDHYNFAQNGIPSIFYFNGVHADYHQPTDTVDKINFEKMTKVGRHIFHTIWELANRKEKIKVDVEQNK